MLQNVNIRQLMENRTSSFYLTLVQAFVIGFWLHGGVESAFHVLSARSTPCTVSANVTSTLALVCSTQLMTSPEVDERTCAVHWQRLLPSGRYSNVTSLSGKYSVWQLKRPRSSTSSSSEERSIVHVLQITALQPDDFTRYRCEVDCDGDDGKRVTRQYEASACRQHGAATAQSKHHECELTMESLDDVSVTSHPCLSQFGDGQCDSSCDSEEMQFDGFDCVSSPVSAAGGGDTTWECDDDTRRRTKTASRRSQCSLVYADGTCDHDCDSASCLWDGGDCIGTALRLSDDVVALTFDDSQFHALTWSTRDVHARQLARTISHLLHTVTRIVDVHSDTATMLTSRSDVSSSAVTSSVLLLKIDNTRCVSRCFTSARSAAMFLAVYRARQLGTLNITSVAVVERVDGRRRCALLNETQFSPERRATSAKRRPVEPASESTVGLADLTSTRLFWIVIMAALSGTCLVLLTVAVVVLMRRVCCYVDTNHRHRHHRRHSQHQQLQAPHHSFTSRHHRIPGTAQLSQLPLADIDLSDDQSRCDATDV